MRWLRRRDRLAYGPATHDTINGSVTNPEAGMLVYRQSTGTVEQNGKTIAGGYSGGGLRFMNRGLAQQFPDHGPIPRGMYRIGWSFSCKGKHGYVLSLTPFGHTAQNRTSFLIHGDSEAPHRQGNASEGCIILPLEVRKAIWDTHDRVLRVQF